MGGGDEGSRDEEEDSFGGGRLKYLREEGKESVTLIGFGVGRDISGRAKGEGGFGRV